MPAAAPRHARRQPSRTAAARRAATGKAGLSILASLAVAAGTAVPVFAVPELPAVTPGEVAAVRAAAEKAAEDKARAEAKAAAAAKADRAATSGRERAKDEVTQAQARLVQARSRAAAASRAAAVAQRQVEAAAQRVATAGLAGAASATPTVAAGLPGTGVTGRGAAYPVNSAEAVAIQQARAGYQEAVAAEKTALDVLARSVQDRDEAARALAEAEKLYATASKQAELRARRAGAASRAAARSAAPRGPALGIDTRLVRPGTGELSSPFGGREHPVTGGYRNHNGLDFRLGDGTAYAAASGKVVFAGSQSGYGLIVIIEHGRVDGETVETAYAHLNDVDVAVGERVDAGQPVGDIGSTGVSSGPHLHFEVRLDDDATDPAPWLGL